MSIHDKIKDLLNNVEKPVIFEIGCRLCEDTKILAQIPNSKVYCFEGDPDVIKQLLDQEKEWLKTNHNKVFLNTFAIGEKTGFVEWYSADNGHSSSLREPKDHLKHFGHVKFEKKRLVTVVSLDLVFRKLWKQNHIDFLWIDVQGAESDVFNGGQDALKHTKYIYFECYDVEMYAGQLMLPDLLKLLPFNYKLIEKWPTEVLVENLDYDKNQSDTI